MRSASGPVAFLDHGNTLTVTLANPQHDLDTVTFEALLRGANAAVVGSEILQFQVATLVGAGQYVLSGLLHGRLGTDDTVGGHVAGERFVLLDGLAAIVRVRDGLARVGVPSTYKAVSLYQPFGDAAPFGFTNTARALRPYAVVNLAGTRGGAGTLAVTWTRRTRLPAPWADSVDAPLAGAAERYELDIRNAADTATLRTLSANTPSAVYTAAEQIADFGSVQASVRVRVFQLSETVGRGIMRSAML